MPPPRYLLPLLVLLAAPAALAQPFFDAPWRSFQTGTPQTGQYAYALTAADLNGDGRSDAVTAQNVFDPGLRVLLNEGTGDGDPATFQHDGTLLPLSKGAWDVVAADLDGDGDTDLAAPNTDTNYSGTTVAVFRNNGNGTFGAAQGYAAGNAPYGITAADMDGDGDVDLAVTNYGYIGQGTQVSVLRNNGNATFAAPTSYTVPPAPARLEAGDLDGDGDADLVVSHDGTLASVLSNTGNGAFGAAVVYDYAASSFGTPGLALLDPDGDGDLDALFSGYYDQFVDDGRLGLLRNNGAGSFTTQLIPYGLPYRDVAADLAAADLDGDGRDDVVGAQQYQPGFVVFRDDNAGSFLPGEMYASVQNSSEESAGGVAAADLDGDGDPDVLTAGRITRLLSAHENLGTGLFPERPIYGRGVSHLVLDLGDVDADGDLDAVTSHGGASSSDVAVYRNSGSGAFAQSHRVAGAYAFARLRDLTGDGVLDLLFVSAPTAPPYDFFTARGNGDGTFGAPVRHVINTCGLAHPNAFDLDEDGDLDVVNTENAGCIGGGDDGTRLFISLNNGNGTFQPAFTTNAGLFPFNTTAGDFDEDGNLDLATASQAVSAVVFGNGDGTFRQPAVNLPSGELSANVLALDLDADGHLDLATLRDYSPDGTAGDESELVLLFGNGAGAFTAVAYPRYLTQGFREWLASGDVDGDGDPDVLAGGVNDALVFLNDGAGALTFDGRYGIGTGALALHYAEATGDGRGDLLALVAHETPPYGGDYGIVVVNGLEGQPAAPVAVVAQPVDGPVVIGAGGGAFEFTVTLTNTTDEPQSFQAWSAVTGPVSRNPVVGPITVTLPAGATVTRTLTQAVPGAAPAGTYSYAVNVGSFPGTVLASDAFPAVKEGAALAGGGTSDALADWEVTGAETLGGSATAATALPGGFALSEVSPNPSRGQAQLTLEVAESQVVRVEVYDGLGRRVVLLHDGALAAGAHALAFDGSALPSGVYVLRVTGETFAATRRVTLLR